MEDMSMVKTLRIWSDGVSFMEQGKFQDALMNFMALEGRTDSSQQTNHAFEEAVEKDKMLAVAHFMLGNVNLALNRNEKALKNFNDAHFYMRGNKLINYQQLGLKSKLYMCEILANRAIAHSRLGDSQDAKNDFLNSLQCKVEPRHSVIDDQLLCWQSGQNIEPLKLPSHAVFQPQKRHLAAINEKRDFLGKSKVVAENELRFPDSRSRSPLSFLSASFPDFPKPVKDEQVTEEHLPEAANAATGRRLLLTDLRKKETRRSLKRVSSPIEPPKKPLPGLPERPNSPRRPPPSPRAQSPLRANTPTPRSGARSPLPLDEAASTQELLRVAADTFKLSEDSFALWCMKNDQLTALQDQDLEEILGSPMDNKPTVYCYENKPE
ncbi:Neutrophil cytosol factor 2 [Desmophyllum pertusum]|uniref:Neutrophil cytosol factor 2 n=1 Tax=Desmophyllum pertusum TaxID=174260 RepID=A0A9X0D184_9CNID|nr:Neutrophil cytosol factor 2 [Desmophyllum pertusum]